MGLVDKHHVGLAGIALDPWRSVLGERTAINCRAQLRQHLRRRSVSRSCRAVPGPRLGPDRLGERDTGLAQVRGVDLQAVFVDADLDGQ